MHARPQRKSCWINREIAIPPQPFGGILKRNGRSPFSRKEKPDEVCLSMPVDVNFDAHRIRTLRICLGNRCSSRLSARSSEEGAARFARRSCNPNTKTAVAKVPAETVGSPRSSRHSVSLLTKSRAAISAVEIPRLRRAMEISRPSLRRACTAGSGMEDIFGTIQKSDKQDVLSNKVCYRRLLAQPH